MATKRDVKSVVLDLIASNRDGIGPIQILNTLSPPPEFRDDEIKGAFMDLLEDQKIEFTVDRKLRLSREK